MLWDDTPEALEALFEFCYCNDYATTSTDGLNLPRAKNLFMQHANALVTADKYMADGLLEFATSRLEELLHQPFQLDVNGGKSAFSKFVLSKSIYMPGDSVSRNMLLRPIRSSPRSSKMTL
jgi:hypothetical protein